MQPEPAKTEARAWPRPCRPRCLHRSFTQSHKPLSPQGARIQGASSRLRIRKLDRTGASHEPRPCVPQFPRLLRACALGGAGRAHRLASSVGFNPAAGHTRRLSGLSSPPQHVLRGLSRTLGTHASPFPPFPVTPGRGSLHPGLSCLRAKAFLLPSSIVSALKT